MENEIETIDIADAGYPARLKDIPNPPKKLYFRGKLAQKDETCVAIVGTRKCSDYGKQAVFNIAQELVDAGVTVVSGLTPGIDTFAHQVAVENGARTIAVLGTGLDKKSIYPQTNVVLADEIVENGGLLVSEYPPGMHGARYTFPQRNRIISGLSAGVLVVEAKEKSGALYTANYAIKQKRRLFAVPGPIFSLNSQGCNQLIKRGALLADSADDILKTLGMAVQKASAATTCGDTPEETKILELLAQEALDIDKIIASSGLPAKKVLSILPILEIKGRIINLGNAYAINHR